jgi:hypothetical protein
MNAEVTTKCSTTTEGLHEADLYETDYQLWLDQTIVQLRSHDFNSLDLENLIEEIESLGKRDKRAVLSYLVNLCEHLLKVKYWQDQRENCIRGWRVEIRNFRFRIQMILQDSPSLKAFLHENFALAYQQGRGLLLDSSSLDPNLIPEMPCFTVEQALEPDWLPWQPE